jgi:hypothetical protein
MAESKQAKQADTKSTKNEDARSSEVATEGDFVAARSETGVEQLAGHEWAIAEWEQSPDGQRFLNEVVPQREKESDQEIRQIGESKSPRVTIQDQLRKQAGQVRAQVEQNQQDRQERNAEEK